MSYETANYLPSEITKRSAVEFSLLLGYRANGTYKHLGWPEASSLIYFEEGDYKSWETVELCIYVKDGSVIVTTRTRVGRSHYDFAMQNRTVSEFKKRFGGRTFKDGGNGEGYDPGVAYPPPASGCKLAISRFDWNISRLTSFLYQFELPPMHRSFLAAGEIFPVMKEMHPGVFVSNALIPYLTSTMEDFFKSTYIALLKYSPEKASILKNARLRGDQLASISDGNLRVEEAFAETLAFHMPSNVAKHFNALDRRLDILAPLKKFRKGRKFTRAEKLDRLVMRRHDLIHRMEIDRNLSKAELQSVIYEVSSAMVVIYKHVMKHYGWPHETLVLSNLPSRREWHKAKRQRSEEESLQAGSAFRSSHGTDAEVEQT